MVRSRESHEAVDNNGKNIPCKRKTYYEGDDANGYGVCKRVVLPILVKAALASTATAHQINSRIDPKMKDDEEHDDSLLYAVVVGIFYAFVMVFLILANIHPSKSLVADLERYETLMEAREQKYNERILARFIMTTEEDTNRDNATSNQDRRKPGPSYYDRASRRADPVDDTANNTPRYEDRSHRAYHSPIRNFRATNIQI